MAATLFTGVEPFDQIVNTPSTEDPMWNLVKIAQAVSEKKTFKDYMIFVHVCSPGTTADNPQGTKFLL